MFAQQTTTESRSNGSVKHPFRNWIATTNDIDSICEMLVEVKKEIDQLREVERELRFAVEHLSVGETKTRRVVGERFEAKLTMPDDYWSQGVLKECAKRWPELAARYLRIATYAVNMVDAKKLKNSAGPAIDEFRDTLWSACSPSDNAPTVVVTQTDATGDWKVIQ